MIRRNMTRAELIHQMALMTDAELEQCIQIYKNGGTTKQLDNYVSRLPEALREQENKNIQNYLKQQNKSKRSIDDLIEIAEQKNPRFIQRLHEEPKMVEFQPKEGITEKGSHYLSYVTTDNGAIVYPAIMEDAQGNLKYYGDSAFDEALNRGDYLEMSPEEADLFTKDYKTTKYKPWFDKWEELYTPKESVEKKEEGGILENVNLNQMAEELNKEEQEEPVYKQIKLCKEGSVLDQLKEQLPDDEIFDLIKNFGIEDLLTGGLKKGSTVSIQIILEDLKEPVQNKETKDIEIGDKSYTVEVVSSEEDMSKGLGERKSLDKDKGMLFDFGETQDEVTFNCEEMQFPIDIIFINKDNEVIRVAENCQPGKDLFTEQNVRYVLEVNTKSGIEAGDEFDASPNDSEVPIMKVLAPDGTTQMELKGGERIFRRTFTKQLIHWAKRSEKSQKDSDFKHLGNMMFKEIQAQDHRPAEYVEVPES